MTTNNWALDLGASTINMHQHLGGRLHLPTSSRLKTKKSVFKRLGTLFSLFSLSGLKEKEEGQAADDKLQDTTVHSACK